MLLSRYVAELIRKGDVKEIKDAMEQSELHGMKTFDQALFDLYQDGSISLEEALQNADSRNDLSLRIRLDAAGEDQDEAQDAGNQVVKPIEHSEVIEAVKAAEAGESAAAGKDGEAGQAGQAGQAGWTG
jgi:hypothetical protein